ncbi:MAG: SprB repeat-containing protein [Bacteroidota bacterium]
MIITDSKGQTKNLAFKVPPPAQGVSGFTYNSIDENCDKSNGSLRITAVTGGQAPYTYSLDQNPFTTIPVFTGLDSGNYVIHIKDINGCRFTDTVHLGRIKGPERIDVVAINSNCDAATGK